MIDVHREEKHATILGKIGNSLQKDMQRGKKRQAKKQTDRQCKKTNNIRIRYTKTFDKFDKTTSNDSRDSFLSVARQIC